MNNDLVTLKIIDGIYDIQPPLSPAHSSLEITLLVLFIISVVVIIAYFVWMSFFSKKSKAKRKMHKLQLEYNENKINTHDTVYEVCAILRQGLKFNVLNNKTPLPEKIKFNQKQWDSFTNQISTLRYNNKVISQSEINTLFKDSLFWLKQWP